MRGLDAIFASEFRRAHQTVTPLSETLALPVNVVPSATWSELAKRITRDHRGEYVLVAGNANNIPALVKALSGDTVTLGEDDTTPCSWCSCPRSRKPRWFGCAIEGHVFAERARRGLPAATAVPTIRALRIVGP